MWPEKDQLLLCVVVVTVHSYYWDRMDRKYWFVRMDMILSYQLQGVKVWNIFYFHHFLIFWPLLTMLFWFHGVIVPERTGDSSVGVYMGQVKDYIPLLHRLLCMALCFLLALLIVCCQLFDLITMVVASFMMLWLGVVSLSWIPMLDYVSRIHQCGWVCWLVVPGHPLPDDATRFGNPILWSVVWYLCCCGSNGKPIRVNLLCMMCSFRLW